MCGICGFAGLPGDEESLQRMLEPIRHRGPDDAGTFVRGNLGLGMRRLSIIDVAGGHQPITNEDASVVVVFNGEIYNYQDLAAGLVRRGHRFRTRCDTEVIVHLYEEHGRDFVRHLRGMFAIALYDVARDALLLVRDRLGVKPLYYWTGAGALAFGSEIKAILACAHVPREPNLPLVDAYLSLRYVPGPETLFAGINKLPAGHILEWRGGEAHIERYWLPEAPSGPFQPDGFYRERFDELFRESVRLRLISEVPLGAFLSGGIDSSAIVATMATLLQRPVQTFTVGFDWDGDELATARATARRLGADHHEVLCTPQDFERLPEIVWHLDEPVGDAIVVPMYLLSKLAREHVTVVLTGEGADETLAGYFPHKVMYWAGRYRRWVPGPVREWVVKPAVRRAPLRMLNQAFSYPAGLGERGRRKLLDFLELVERGHTAEQYRFLISLFDQRDKSTLYSEALRPLQGQVLAGLDRAEGPRGSADLDRVLGLQYGDWLPDDILMKQDKMTMANSIEGRVPFLDHKLVEFLWQTPPHLKLGWTRDKVLLREYLRSVMPEGARRAKVPFYIPIDKYLGNGALREMVEECLSERSVRRRGYFDWPAIRRLRDSVDEREFVYGKQVLSLVSLELWHRIFIDREAGWVAAA